MFIIFKEGFLFHLVNTEMNTYKTFTSKSQLFSNMKRNRVPWVKMNKSRFKGEEILKTNILNDKVLKIKLNRK